jgi:cyclic lactone autoinducer peptide
MFILESITIFAFLAILFVIPFRPRYVFSFGIICAAIYVCELITNPFLMAVAIIMSVSIIWTVFHEVSINTFLKALVTNFICLLAMLAIQFWIPLYILITGTTDINELLFGIPCRLLEYITLFIIYSVKVKPIILSKALTGIAKATVKPASIWWVYQPKIPRGLK